MTTIEERHAAIHAEIMEDEEVAELQGWVDTGTAWLLEGSVGRSAMDLLRAGVLVLPLSRHRDYWGNVVPSALDVADVVDSPGSVANAEACVR